MSKTDLSTLPISSVSTVASIKPSAAGLTKLPPLTRSAEVLRVFVLRFEYWLSPTGKLRGLLRLILLLSLCLAAICLCLAPFIGSLLGQVVAWSAMIVTIINNVATAIPMGLGKVVVGVAAITIVWRLLRK